jgi:hypothetical protein
MKPLREYIKAGAEITARAARMYSGTWSARMPRATHVVVEGDKVSVQTESAIAPQSRAFQGGIRHPLNYPTQTAGNEKHWAPTPKRPYMTWAWRDTKVDMEKQMAQWAENLAAEKLGD